MIEAFKNISLSYKLAPLEIRNKYVLDEKECARLISLLKEYSDITDILILSTCNRTEFYYEHSKSQAELFFKLLGTVKGFVITEEDKKYFTINNNHEKTSKYLYRVALGLEAQVVGDLQITNQVKRAYQLSADMEVAGPFLHRILHSIFFSNKRMVQETAFRDGAASVSYATVELVEELASAIQNPHVLVLGAGEMGEDVAKNLSNTKIDRVTIANRTLETATKIGQELGFMSIGLEHVMPQLSRYDIIVSTIPGGEFNIDASFLQNTEILSYKHFIDIAVPGSVSPDVEDVNGVTLYNIDQINNRTEETIQKRLDSIPKVESIIDESIIELGVWVKELEVSPTIHKIKQALNQIREDEMKRYVKELSESEQEKVDMVTKSIIQKIIKLPVLQLKNACKKGDAESLIEVLHDLFDLEKQGVDS